MTYRSHMVGPSRAFDHIYDPLYVASDRKDVCRANHAALARTAPIGIFPVYQSMFSELPRLTRNHYVMHRNPLPYFPEVHISPLRLPHPSAVAADMSKVLGAERPKFFCHPNMGETGCNVRYAADSTEEEYCGCDGYEPPEHGPDQGGPRFREVASQTMYRESSAQTQPWMPTAVLKESVMPAAEIVYVAEMLQHTRFPGVNEVEIVERARRKRSWEYALGSCDSIDEWRQQKLMLQIFEWEEWVARERQIDRYQMLRLQLVAKIMEKRERDTHQATEGKMENTKRRINKARNDAMHKLEVTFERNLRKLERKRQEQIARYGSRARGQADVPLVSLEALRSGGRKKYSKQSYDYDPNLIEVGLAKLEKKATITHKFVDPRDQRPELWKPKEVCREFQKGFWSDSFLRKLYESLKQFRNRKDSERTVPQCLIVVSSPTESLIPSPLPATSPEKENDTLYQQAILLQRLLRGRATQELIHRDYALEHDLMEDLIASHRLPVVEEFFPHSNLLHGGTGGTGVAGSVRERYLHILRNEQLLDEFVESSTHAQMSSLMGTLERELTRLQNERNTQAFYLLTERERGRRESRSQGADETMRWSDQKLLPVAGGDELDIYLENALLEQQQQADDVEEWRDRIHELARQFDEEADRPRRTDAVDGPALAAEPSITTDHLTGMEGPGTITGSLADEMLLPDIFRRAARENIKFKQRTLLANVHELLYNRKDEEESDALRPGPKVEIVSPTTEPPPPEEQRVVNGLLAGLIDRAVQQPVPESAYSENEVEELPEDEEALEGSDFFGLDSRELGGEEALVEEHAGEGEVQEEEEEIGRMASELIEDILSHVLDDVSE
ncbi:cilia- and flagella-associated protein 91-like [Anopheles albimanus]|uniref:Cilia- and flagella-associated protein 91 n=1 Tax=Anopheles albimanus TaxID=7167 RepID=A0A182FWG7_ANOAL|nr:cilia- and flagella-associated protein 91-like [Anopheles albimanus]